MKRILSMLLTLCLLLSVLPFGALAEEESVVSEEVIAEAVVTAEPEEEPAAEAVTEEKAEAPAPAAEPAEAAKQETVTEAPAEEPEKQEEVPAETEEPAQQEAEAPAAEEEPEQPAAAEAETEEEAPAEETPAEEIPAEEVPAEETPAEEPEEEPAEEAGEELAGLVTLPRVTGVTADSTSETTIDVNWTKPKFSGIDTSKCGYEVRWSASSSMSSYEPIQVAGISTTSCTITSTDLVVGNTYYIKVLAYYADGTTEYGLAGSA